MEMNEFQNSRILLVEDEENLAIGLEYNLNDEGYAVDLAKDGKQALELFYANEYDLVILDIMLPYLNGFELAEKIRAKDPQMPVLMLTARTSADDRVKGLEAGADDYMVKPFHLQELLLRVKGMLKRKLWYKSIDLVNPVYRFGSNEINFETLSCSCESGEILLTQREAMVMKYLIERRNRIVTRKELLENVWHISSDVETRTVDIFISRLRKYFEKNPSKPDYIKSIRSSGYTFTDG